MHPIALIVTDNLTRYGFTKTPKKTKQNPSATGVKLSIETGNPEINVSSAKPAPLDFHCKLFRYDHTNCLLGIRTVEI
jgi:hypothetical protein